MHIYTARAGKLTWFGAADNRGHTALDGFAIRPGYHGTLVRDDYAGYAKYDKHLAGVQLCGAHLLRALRGIGEHDEDPYKTQRCWTEPATQALLDAKAAVARARAGGATGLDPDLLTDLRERYDKAVVWGIATNRLRDWPAGIPATPWPSGYATGPGRSGASPSTSPSRSPTTRPSSPNAWSNSK